MSQQKKIITFLITLFLASSVWLFYVSNKIMNPNKVEDWWTIYFSDPKSSNLNFIIENHNNNSEFSWKILENNQTKKEGQETILKGDKKEIEIYENFEGKVIVETSLENEEREIYKNK